jgi:uncharacterized protein
MHRRNILAVALAAVGAAVSTAVKVARAEPAKPGRAKVAYHLCDLDKVQFVMGNIQNHFDGVGGPDKITIALVVHGPALKAFHTASANADLVRGIERFSKSGVELNACGNTMRAQNVTLKNLLPGFVSAEQGGVVRLAELQAEGYAYLRP